MTTPNNEALRQEITLALDSLMQRVEQGDADGASRDLAFEQIKTAVVKHITGMSLEWRIEQMRRIKPRMNAQSWGQIMDELVAQLKSTTPKEGNNE